MTSETTAQDPRPKTQDPGLDESTLPLQVQEFLRAADRVTAWLIKPNVPIVPRADLARITAAMAQAASRINVAAQTQSVRNWLRDTLEGRGVNLVPVLSQEPAPYAVCPNCGQGPGAAGQGPGARGQGPGERNTGPDTILKVHCPHCAECFKLVHVRGPSAIPTCPMCDHLLDGGGFRRCGRCGLVYADQGGQCPGCGAAGYHRWRGWPAAPAAEATGPRT